MFELPAPGRLTAPRADTGVPWDARIDRLRLIPFPAGFTDGVGDLVEPLKELLEPVGGVMSGRWSEILETAGLLVVIDMVVIVWKSKTLEGETVTALTLY